MRLLNTTTFELKEFLSVRPPYAILSHTWGPDELVHETFHTWDKTSQNTPSTKKTSGFCSLAHRDGYEWCWIDTICIDKKSSAELSEAINSMFCWYKEADVCYAYLSDVKIDYSAPDTLKDFEKSRWHTRGWTLQELLAPRRVEFFDVDWDQIGTKTSLQSSIADISGIRKQVLVSEFVPSSLDSICVAEKMSWAARRKTSRTEDIAYCLLGIFDISMPLLYGEDEKAFQRLQRNILSQTEDFSLFAWKGFPYPRRRTDELYHLFALTPFEFCEDPEVRNLYNWRYESLESGPYHLNCKAFSTMKDPGFVLGEPVERINGFDFKLVFFGESLAVLGRISSPGISSSTEYLCLPVAQVNGHYVKSGVPVRVSRPRDNEISCTFTRILSRPNGRRNPVKADYYNLDTPLLLLSLRTDQETWTQLLRVEVIQKTSILILRVGSAEFIVFFGYKEWMLVTDWNHLRSSKSLLPTFSPDTKCSNFTHYKVREGLHTVCHLKERPKGWLMSQEMQSAVAKQQCEKLVTRQERFFSLDVGFISPEQVTEKLEFVASTAVDRAEMEHLFESLEPREFILANKEDVWNDTRVEMERESEKKRMKLWKEPNITPELAYYWSKRWAAK
jgi:hypothetical protein